MRKLTKNSKAMLCAISLVFLGFARASAGVGTPDHRTVSAASHATGVHATLHRAPVRTRKAQSAGLLAIIPASSFQTSLSDAGPTLPSVESVYKSTLTSGPSARAPPVS